MAALFSTTSGVGVVDTRTRSGTITLPLTTQIPNRYLQIKDLYGSFGSSSLTLSTQLGESFDDRTTSKLLTDPFSFMTLYAASTGRWAVLAGTQTIQQTMSSLIVSSITSQTGQFQVLSSLSFNVSSINGQVFGSFSGSTNSLSTGLITTSTLNMIDINLGTQQIIAVSSGILTLNGAGITGGGSGAGVAQLIAGTNISLSPAGGTGVVTVNAIAATPTELVSTTEGLQYEFNTADFISSLNLLSTVDGLGSAGYVSTLTLTSTVYGAISSFSSLLGQVGPGGITSIPSTLSTFALFTSSIFASTIQSRAVSTQQIFTSSIYADNLRVSTSFATSLSTSIINFTGGFGYLEMPDIYPNTVFTSTITVTGITTLSTVAASHISSITATFLNLTTSTINTLLPQTAIETEGFLVAVSSAPGGRAAVSYDDGVTWIARGLMGGVSDFAFTVAWNGSMWLATGRDGGGNISSSPDGLNWTSRTSVFNNSSYGLAWNGRLWVATGYNTVTLSYSFNGISWVSSGATIFTTQGNGVAWNGRMFVATGQGTNTLAYSFDGINWVGLGATIFTTAGWGVAWNGTLWVAVGQGTNTIATSPDGITWTGRGASVFTTNGWNVAWNGVLWVAVGEGTNTIATSTDGITWTARTNGLTTRARAIAWSGSLWVAGGAGTFVIATSPDGITWTGRNAVGLTTVTGIAARRVLPYVGEPNNFQQPNLNIGTVPTATTIQFFGLQGTYNNTVLAEVSTGAGNQELLLFKGATASDRIRLQTTGDVRFETGVSSRVWNNTVTTLSNPTPAMIINSSSNVGIQTAPASGFALDVAGAVRGTTLSTLRFQMSSIEGVQYTGSNTNTSSIVTFSMSSGTTSASTFTGRWNDAQFYVLQTI